MKINWETRLSGTGVVLVPYRSDHVPKYHEWMSSPELRELTGSEPLTLEEEYRMQETWRDSDDKCTFIVLSKEMYESSGGGEEIGSMVGDTNLFITKDDETEETVAEAEIMIAEPRYRTQSLTV